MLELRGVAGRTVLALALALASSLMWGVLPASAAAAVPKFIGVAPASVELTQGLTFSFSIFVKNKSSKKTKPVPLEFLLSRSGSTFTATSLGGGLVPKLKRKARATLEFSVTVPAVQAPGEYELLVCRTGTNTCFANLHVTVTAAKAIVFPPPPPPPPPGPPGSILDLSNWKLTLPIDGPDDGVVADEVSQPALSTFSDPLYFHTNAGGNGVVFVAPTPGATTPGSTHARSELREMNGSLEADWDELTGTHGMTVRESINRLPGTVKREVVAAQIHDGANDVLQIRLEGTRLFALFSNGTNPDVTFDLDPSYPLGTKFTLQIGVSNGAVAVSYNGTQKVFSDLGYAYKPTGVAHGWYFKAGAYTQSNEAGTSSEVQIFEPFVVTHN